MMRRVRCPQRYCATIRRDQQGGHGLLEEAQTSEPARSRWAFPCAPMGFALLSKRTAMLATSRLCAARRHRSVTVQNGTQWNISRRTCAKSSGHIWLWTRLMR